MAAFQLHDCTPHGDFEIAQCWAVLVHVGVERHHPEDGTKSVGESARRRMIHGAASGSLRFSQSPCREVCQRGGPSAVITHAFPGSSAGAAPAPKFRNAAKGSLQHGEAVQDRSLSLRSGVLIDQSTHPALQLNHRVHASIFKQSSGWVTARPEITT